MGPAEVVLGKEPLLLCFQVIRLEGYFTLWGLVRLANGGNAGDPRWECFSQPTTLRDA